MYTRLACAPMGCATAGPRFLRRRRDARSSRARGESVSRRRVRTAALQRILGRPSDGRPRAFRRVRSPSTILYTTQAPRPATAKSPGLRGLHGFGGRLRPPARAALRAAGAHLRGSGALSGPGAAAVATRATCQKEAAATKAWGIGERHRETARGLGRPLPHRDGRRARFGVYATSRRLQLTMVRGLRRPARGERVSCGEAASWRRCWCSLVASRRRRAPWPRRRAVVSTTASARRRGGCATLAPTPAPPRGLTGARRPA